MKKISAFFLSFLMIVFLGTGCNTVVHVNSSGKVPPGQMKKMTGSQSDKPYAPGQQENKHNDKH